MDTASSSSWVRGVLDMFAAQGVDVARALQSAAIPAQRLQDPSARFHPDEVTQLWKLAISASGNPALGLDRRLAERFVNFDVVGYATLSSPDLRTALEEFARYLALISSATTFELEAEGEDSWLVMGHTGYTLPLPPQRSAYSLLALLVLCRWVTRSDVRPVRAHFSFAPFCGAQAFDAAFGCPARFSQPDNRFLLRAADLSTPLPSRDATLLAVHEQVLDERLAALDNASTARRVTQEIARRLPGGEPRRQDVAKSLALSDRTLQRRLQLEGTSFQQLLDDARRLIAGRYLADPRLALGEVAHRLGFADQSNFFRACRRWFGRAPGQYRDDLARQRVQGQ